MQDIDKDIDELFNSAAENYPLRTDGSNWDKVAAGMQAAKEGSGFLTSGNRRGVLVSAFLILFITSGLLYLSSDSIMGNKEGINNAVTESINNPPETPRENTGRSSQPTIESVAPTALKPYNSEASANNINKNNHTFSLNNSGIANNLNSNSKNIISATKTNITHNSNSNESLVQTETVPYVSTNELKENNHIKEIDPENSLAKNEEKIENRISKNTASTSIKVKPIISNRFYAGVIASPEFSFVQKQGTSKLGGAYGLIGGYKMNNTFSAEIGLIRAHKNYHTSGQFFSRENLKLKNSTTIEELNAYNKVTTIPVSVRVNFHGKKQQGQFFATAGAATYLIHEESYDYTLNKAGNMADVNRHYNKGETRVFSNVVFSTGYEKKMNANGSLRVEPYYSIPVKGVGVGNVSLSTVGLNVGYVTELHFK